MVRKRKRVSRIPLLIFVILVLLSFATLAVINIIDFSQYVVADVLRVSENVIVVGNNCTAIIAETSQERAQSIDSGMRGVIEERPNTHDTFVAVLKSFNITLESVSIESFNGNYYSSDLLLRYGDKISKIDTKPSDAIALAVRTNSTIYINKTLLQEVGRNIC